MKYVLFILIIDFFIIQCPAEFVLADQLNLFLSKFGITLNSQQYEEIQSDTNVEAERVKDPLYILLVNSDKEITMGTISNPMFLEHFTQSGVFVDFLIACPKKDETQATTENSSEWTTRTLVVENSYASLFKKYEKEGGESEAEISRTNSAKIQDLTVSEASTPGSNLEQKPEQNIISQQDKNGSGDAPEHNRIGIDSNQEKKDVNFSNHFKKFEANSINSIQQEQLMQPKITHLPEANNEMNSATGKKIAVEDEAILKKNKLGGADQQKDTTDYDEKNIDPDSISKKDTDNLNEIQIDSDSVQKTEEINPDVSNTSSTSQSEIQPVQEPVIEMYETLKDPSPVTEKYATRAIEVSKNFKCDEPIKAHLVERPSQSMFQFFLGGFEIFMEKNKDFNIMEFKKSSNRKYKWFWSFTIVLTKENPHVICVYQEVQYNKDTYSPEINDNFNNHDLGKKKMFPGIDIAQLYELKNQEKVFSKLFTNVEERERYFNRENFLVRVHLAPLHNFLTPVVRQSGKTYGNVGPMWKSIRDGAWRKLENYIDILSQVVVELVVITGTYGTLNLDGKDVYLADDNKIPVPLAFWKMVIYQSDLTDFYGILIITYNNPYQEIDDIICKENLCQKYGWGHIQEDDVSKGRTTCCKFTREILQHIPILVGAQPTRIFNLYELSSNEEMGNYTESGGNATPYERDRILEKLQLKENVDGEKIAAANEETTVTDEKTDENVENENEHVDETVPLLHKELSDAFRSQKLVEI